MDPNFQYLTIGKASDVLDKKDRSWYRFLEMLPGILAWVTLGLIILLSFKAAVFMAVFIIAFDVYWLVKTLFLSVHLRSAYGNLRRNMKIHWLEKLSSLDPADYSLKTIRSWKDIYHVIFLPIYKEETSVLEATMDGLANSNYPKEHMIVVMCWEERGGAEMQERVARVKSKYLDRFFMVTSIMHPEGLPDEIPGKGSNTAFAGQVVKTEIVDRLGLKYDHIIVSNLDIDTVVSPEYFGVLTYSFLTTADPLHASYQPVPLYINNIWEAPSFARVVAFAATFWQTINQERPERYVTFSSHSMSWQALVDIGFWQKNMVSEDSRVFWQCFLRYDGNYRTIPLGYPVSMDANVGKTFWQTIKNIYKQQRRWGYGVENVPYMLYGFGKNKRISKGKKWFFGFISLEGFHSWATNAIIIFILGWLPVMVGGPEFNQTVLALNLPSLTRLIMTASIFGLMSSAILALVMLPPRPPKFGRFRYLWMFLEWLLFPATTIVLGALPGLEAQTRLMIGKYMGFWVTPKFRIIEKVETQSDKNSLAAPSDFKSI